MSTCDCSTTSGWIIENAFHNKNCQCHSCRPDILPENDPVNKPAHYVFGRKYEAIDVMEDWFPDNPQLFTALKYLARAGRKDPKKEKEDLEKCIYFINRYIKLKESTK